MNPVLPPYLANIQYLSEYWWSVEKKLDELGIPKRDEKGDYSIEYRISLIK